MICGLFSSHELKKGIDTHCDFDGHRKFDKAFRKRSVNNFSVLYSQTNPYSQVNQLQVTQQESFPWFFASDSKRMF